MKTILSTTLDSNQRARLIKTYHAYSVAFNHPYITHAFKVDETMIQIYTSGKVVFSGPDAQTFKELFSSPQRTMTHAGSDEVGTGDYFGPVVVCACVCDESQSALLSSRGIMDSKLMDDETMITLYHEFKDSITHSLMIVSPSKYNDIHRTHNMNAIKAKLHYEAYVSLSKKTKLPSLCVVDQFTPKDKFYQYLNIKPESNIPLHFETKAESKYIAVAMASVFARAVFVLTLRQLENHYETPLPKGASNRVDEAAKVFIDKHGKDKLNHVAKLHFKNTSRVIDR
jgi:ribonuclease HIII